MRRVFGHTRARRGQRVNEEQLSGVWTSVRMQCTKHQCMETETRTRTPHEPQVDFSGFMNGLVDDVKGYLEAQKDLLVLGASHKAAVLLSKAVHRVAVLAGLGAALLFLGVSLSLYLGEQLGSAPLGFLLTGALALVLVLLFNVWWTSGGRERYILARINEMNNDDDEV